MMKRNLTVNEFDAQHPTKRRFKWRYAAIGFVVLAIGVVAYALVWAMTVRPSPSVDYAAQMSALSGAHQPGGENGWPHIIEAVRLYGEVHDAHLARTGQQLEFDHFLSAQVVEPSEQEAILSALDELRAKGAIESLQRATLCPNAVRMMSTPPGQSLLSVSLIDLSNQRHLAKARMAAMRAAIEAGDIDDAVAALDQTLYMARACTLQATLIEHLVGHSLAALCLQQLRYAVLEHKLEPGAIEKLVGVLEQRLPFGPLSMAFEGERRFMLDMVQRVYSDGGWGGGVFLPAEMDGLGLMDVTGSAPQTGRPSPLQNITGLAFAGRNQTVAQANVFYDNLVRLSKLSRRERLSDSFSDNAFIQNLGWRHALLTRLLPAVGAALQTPDSTECQIAGTRVMLAIEEYRARHDRLPADLSELAPEYMVAIPNDPYTARPFFYRVLSGTTSVRGYVLYSTGADGEDNAGKPAARPADALQQNRAPGFDFVFTTQRDEP